MSEDIASFFDNDPSTFKMWNKKITSIGNTQDDPIVFQGKMFKKVKQTSTLKPRRFVLTRKFLYYLKEDSKHAVCGAIETNWVRVEFPSESRGKGNPIMIRFIRNFKYTDFWVLDEQQFQEWRVHLSKVFVQTDFHNKFKALELVSNDFTSRVYMAQNKKSLERHTIRAFPKELLNKTSKSKDAFCNEIQLLKNLKHPAVVNLEEVHETKTSIYLVMEPLEGPDFFEYATKKHATSLGHVQMIMKSLLDVLNFLASKKIMHRDIKPENLVLTENIDNSIEGLKLINFGLASRPCDSPQLFRRCGTPGYMAPEIINLPEGHEVNYNTKCDVFSAGVILYILTTSRAPFHGKTFQEVLDSNKIGTIDFTHPKLERFPYVKDLLLKMLDRNPETRLSAGECLQHEFFAAVQTSPDPIEKLEQKLIFSKSIQEFALQHKQSLKSRHDIKNKRESLYMRDDEAYVSTVFDTSFSQTGRKR
jgi:serine/threonine protein kinase